MKKSQILPSLLCLGFSSVGSQAQTTYAIDINDADFPAETEPGWVGLPATHTGDGGTVNDGGLDFTIGSSDGARLRGGAGTPTPNALTADFAFDDGAGQAIILFFGGAGDLAAGDWQVELWTHDETSPPGDFQIVGYRTNNTETIISNSVSTSGDNSTPAITFNFNSDGASAYDVFIRENNDSDRSRLNAVRLTRLGARDVQIDPVGIPSTIGANASFSTLIPTAVPLSSSYTYTLVAGDGDTNNAEFTISGDQLMTSGTYPGHSVGETLSIRVRAVDSDTGVYEGVITIPVINDSDLDGLDDDWEQLHFGNLTTADDTTNSDSDLLTDVEEFQAGTNPTLADTDMDGLDDDIETNDGVFLDEFATGTDPNVADTDNDGVNDGDEVFIDFTNPLDEDTDDDGLKDGDEKTAGTDPFIADSDGDGFSDSEEINNSTDPTDNTSPASSGFLCAYWPLDVANDQGGFFTTPDLAGNSYDLDMDFMDATHFVTEAGRQAASFNGVDQLLYRFHDPIDDLPINKHSGNTVSLWVKANGTGQSDLRFFSESSSTDGVPLYNLGTHNAGTDGSINFYTRNNISSPGAQLSFSTTALDDTWRHVAVTSNAHNEVVAIYIDGVLDRDDMAWRDLRTTLEATTIGGIFRDVTSHWINGFVDDVSLWKKVLTDSEIAALAAGTSPLNLDGPQPTGIVACAVHNAATGAIDLSWTSEAGKNYIVRHSDDLTGAPSTWTILNANVASGGTTTTFSDTTSPLPSKRFYVIEESP